MEYKGRSNFKRNASKGVVVAKCDSHILFVLQDVRMRDRGREYLTIRKFCIT